MQLTKKSYWFSPNRFLQAFVSGIYDKIIVHMTEKWYRTVLERLEEGSTVLDVGIGTAGALLKCKDIVVSKKLSIIGIDYNEYYVASAQQAIQNENIEKSVQIHHCDLYNQEQLDSLLHDIKNVDAVYFSGSFSLLPSPTEALKMAASILKKKNSATSTVTDTTDGKKIYITQTYQRRSPPLISVIKPLIKYLITIDFGQLLMEEDVLEFFKDESVKEVLELEEHEVIKNSVDSYWQAAYLSVLKTRDAK